MAKRHKQRIYKHSTTEKRDIEYEQFLNMQNIERGNYLYEYANSCYDQDEW